MALWIKMMPLGTEVGLGPGNIVLDGDCRACSSTRYGQKILLTSLHALAVLWGAPPPFLPMTSPSRRVLRGAAAVSRSTASEVSGWCGGRTARCRRWRGL